MRAKKDVAGCDNPRVAAKQALIRGSPNATTHPDFIGILLAEFIG
jgi:hypothetical protein